MDDDQTVPVSAIEHYSYCPRQCALIHVEQCWAENLLTTRGRLGHERVDAGHASTEGTVRTVRSMIIWSDRLGLNGKADVVEFHASGPRPVEYKVGRKHGEHAELQLCAQAMCLEEMLKVPVPEGDLFFRGSRTRHSVVFTYQLRRHTEDVIGEVRSALSEPGPLPPVAAPELCANCSLDDACMSSVVRDRHRLRGLQGSLFVPLEPGSDA